MNNVLKLKVSTELSVEQVIKRLGGEGILQPRDIFELNAGVRRVLYLLSDRQWHSAEEIRKVAKGSEGTRRARDLRSYGYVLEKKRSSENGRLFYYRLSLPPWL